MSLPIDITNVVKVPFPPSISVNEIVKIHLKNKIKSVNQTMNSFMIYRKEYNQIVAKFNRSSKDVSKCVSISWKNEPDHIKDYYRQMAENVKNCFREKVPLCFTNSNQVDNTNDNHVPLDTSLNTNQNFQNTNYPFFNMDQDAIYSNPIVSNNFKNECQRCLDMDEYEFMNYLSENLALIYKEIIRSL
ncbi:5039_t:CDS:1 [Diversispora eburnea]|uniref:5039_t:CDS:1 n=1 Tax=Diversispora eburnea TaxID=1213867 RepID=A0A9N8WD32_9GLOM|nr:5039_t:CDS:1 [Diversispora eburnea]